MSESRLSKSALQREHAMAEVLKLILPQLGSGPEVLSGGKASDSGATDYWMLTNMPAEILIPLAGLKTIATADDRKEIHDFVEIILRGLKGVNGFTSKQLESVSLGIGGGIGRKTVKRPGLVSRNITNRNWKRKAESEGAEIEE